ncbi:hypothetical protein F4Z99_19995 [Candidatus Poribacteria bacterium]|nr:hypothetical protein [Candidatus Poribacteria bacterium]
MADIHVNFSSPGVLPSNVDKTRKILWLGNDTVQIKCYDGGQIKSFNCDFSNAPVTTDSQVTPNGYSDIIYRYHKTDDLLSLWIACIVPENTELPKPAYQLFSPTAAATIWKAVNENDDAETSLTPAPDWIPGALTDAEKQARVQAAIVKWRQMMEHWLLQSPKYAHLIPEITKHLALWLRAADYVVHELYGDKVVGTLTYDWLILEAIIKEATKGPVTLDPDGDGAYNVEFFQHFTTLIDSYPNGPTAWASLWVNWWELTETSTVADVVRKNMVTEVLMPADTISARTKTWDGVTLDSYNPANIYWRS